MPAPALSKCVLLPGLDGSGIFFAELTEALHGKAETLVLTYPEHGPQSYTALADHLRRQMPDEDYVIVAESFAGPLAILLAAQAPVKPKSLILAASFARNPFPLFGGMFGNALPGLINDKALPVMEAVLLRPGDHEMTWKVFQTVSRLDPNVLRDRIKAVTTCDVTKPLAQLDLPILYLQGTEDKLVSAAHGALVARTGKHVTLARVATPHFVLQYDVDATVRDHILPFLEACA
ncbi:MULTISPECIES: alpha/beta fold hydrolase [Asticcacaulis]|uniref:alpha/beta fold hydrolase n=1 Tax=Asticcacaulis TaxID=76890 RepID=UPI001AE7C213|nr:MULTISPECIES: alpha/beta fold hydrolase [Asticcacaulis]MBP2158851.1 pimeloyl-ACP methyl ester carboxylesterase [Asticcacaulis solisilvae]MDR6799896.1 pimeloyl-ACP methyl ester carboxylesterase [Asticcacaulis sp. BE141]